MTSEDASTITWGRSGPLGGSARDGLALPEPGAAGHARVEASFALMAALIDECSLVEALILVADRSCLLADAPTAFIALPGDQPNTLTVNIAVGSAAKEIQGLTVQISRSLLGRAYTSRRTIASRIASGNDLPAGPILLVPLDTGEATRGVLAVAGDVRRLPFSDLVRRQLIRFATSSAALIEIAEERRSGEGRHTISAAR